ncbi:hypothetical protein PM082_003934 [Marasmius tenuissimus]|nr:hypothetical protein PM082_003934 [Marasmius tenuissimus]
MTTLTSKGPAVSVDQRLHREVIEFISCIESTPSEKFARQEVFRRIQDTILGSSYEFGGGIQVGLYGSVPLGIELPTADLDISITAPRMKRTPQQALKRAAVLLKKAGVVSEFQGRYHARVPLLCAKTTPSLGGIGVDITINNATGFSGIEEIRKYLSKMPALRPLVLVLKSFLHQRGLSDPAMGGLGSYALTCMCISFLQLNPGQRPPECIEKPMEKESLGILLTDFMMYYGVDFPYDQSYISASQGKLLPKSSASDWIKRSQELKISIECLVVPKNDIGRPTSKMNVIKSEFKSAVATLLQGSFTHIDILRSIVCIGPVTCEAREDLQRAVIALQTEQQQPLNHSHRYFHHNQPTPEKRANNQLARHENHRNSNRRRMQHPLPAKPSFSPYPSRPIHLGLGEGLPRRGGG